MATVLFSYRNHTDPASGGAVHGYHVVEELRRKHRLVTAEPKTDNRLERYPRTVRGARQLLRDADCIYMRCDARPWEEALLALNARTRRLPLIVEVNAPAEEQPAYGSVWRKHPALARTRVVTLRARYHRIVRMAREVLCVSEQLADWVRDTYPINGQNVVGVANGGVPVDALPEPRGDGRFRVVWGGGTRWPWQAISTMVEAACLLLEQAPEAEVHIHSDADPSRYPPVDRLRWLPLVPHVAWANVLSEADAALCLYRWDNPYVPFYGSSLKLFDYMAAGLPVVATDIGQIPEVIEDGVSGFLVPDDARTVADRLRRLADDPELRRRMGRAARDRIAERYSWRHTGDAILAAIDRALARR